MKITDIKSYVYAPLPTNPWFFIEVETDEGVTGLGETSDYRATQMLAGGIDAIKHLLIGEDPSHIEELWQRVFRNYSTINGRGFVSHLVSAVDVALWDIRGKALGQPVYQLLGGPVRPNVPLYTHIQDQSYEGVTIAMTQLRRHGGRRKRVTRLSRPTRSNRSGRRADRFLAQAWSNSSTPIPSPRRSIGSPRSAGSWAPAMSSWSTRTGDST